MRLKPSKEVPGAVAAKEPQERRFFLPGSLGPTTLLRLLCLKAVYLPMLPALSVTAAASSGAIGDFGA